MRRKRGKTAKRTGEARSDIDTVLDRLTDSHSFIATAAKALLRAQQYGLTKQDVGHVVTTLEHGVKEQKSALDALDGVYHKMTR